MAAFKDVNNIELRSPACLLAVAIGLVLTSALFVLASPGSGDTNIHPHAWEAISLGMFVAYLLWFVPGMPQPVVWIIVFLADWLIFSILSLTYIVFMVHAVRHQRSNEH